MTWVNSQFTIDDAIARGLDVYELLISNWGVTGGAGALTGTPVFPAVNTPGLPTVAGIAMGPLSLVDRVMVAYDLQKIIPQNATWDVLRRVDVNNPLMWLQPGNRGLVTTTSANFNSLAFYPAPFASEDPLNTDACNDSTAISALAPLNYVKVDGTAATWGPAVATSFARRWLAPSLHLYLYLRPPTIMAPTKRQRLIYNKVAFTASPNEALGFQIPVFGRKTVAFNLRCDFAVSIRVGALPSTVSGDTLWEAPLIASTNLVANVAQRFVVSPINADWMFIHYTSATPNALLYLELVATDD